MRKCVCSLLIITMIGCGAPPAPTVDLSTTSANEATQAACTGAVTSASGLEDSIQAAQGAFDAGTSRADYFEATLLEAEGDILFVQLTCLFAVLDQVYGTE